MKLFRSVKTKIIFVVLFILTAITALLIVVNTDVAGRYRALKTAQCQSAVDAESQRVNAVISIMENNVQKLALIGELLAESPGEGSPLGRTAVEGSFPHAGIAVGGGIFYAPFSFRPDTRRVCFYAFRNDLGDMVYDPSFEDEAYDYHSYDWYKIISAGALKDASKPTWTAPYYDGAGTNALMTTVGFGMFKDGALLGVATGDWVLTDISASISQIKPTERSRALFGDLDGDMILTYTGGETGGDSMALSALPWLENAIREGHVDLNGERDLVFSNVLSNRMIIVSIVPESELFADVDKAYRNMWVGMGVACLAIAYITTAMLGRFINKPVTALAEGVSLIAAGDLSAKIEMTTGDEFQSLAGSVNEMASKLGIYVENLTRVTAERERIGAELSVAAGIQGSMLPRVAPSFPGRDEFDIFALMQPAREVGGDFYDFFAVDPDTLAVVIADVSGKGVPAALFMVIAKTLIKSNAQFGKNPEEVFAMVNALLSEDNDSSMFVTAFMGYLHLPTGRLTYANAGHNLPLVQREGLSYRWLDTPRNFVLAGMEDTVYVRGETVLLPGDRLFLYTDGLTEAMNQKGDMFSDPRLLATANEYGAMAVRDFSIAVRDAVTRFADGAEQADDVTMLALLYKGPQDACPGDRKVE